MFVKAFLQLVDFILKASAAYAITPEGAKEFAEIAAALGMDPPGQEPPASESASASAGGPRVHRSK